MVPAEAQFSTWAPLSLVLTLTPSVGLERSERWRVTGVAGMSARLCLLSVYEIEISSRFVTSCKKEEPQFDMLHLAESLGEDHSS